MIIAAMVRMVLTFILAMLFGVERQRSHKPIGFGTFAFVAVGSCALAITSVTMFANNPIPLLTAVVTGIGFLGAGAMIKTSDKIFGVTTSASIWLFAIFGLMMGIGEYYLAAITYGIVWAVILIDRYLEKQGIGSYQRKITIVTNGIVQERDIRTILLLGVRKYKLIDTTIDKKNSKMTLTYLIEGNKEHINGVPKKFFEQTWFESCRLE